MLAPKLSSILLPQLTDTLNIYPSPVYQVLNVNWPWSAFLKGILPTLQGHGWYNGTHGGHQLGSGDPSLLPLTIWPTDVSLATMWVSWFLLRSPFAISHPTTHPMHPFLLLSILMAERDGKNTKKFSHQR